MDSFSLNIKGELRVFESPVVMGIINATPDSFYAPSRVSFDGGVASRAARMIEEGAGMLDIGACSTRPGAAQPSEEDEIARLVKALDEVRGIDGGVIISVDTYRSAVARAAVEHGADIINDISGGSLDDAMFRTVAELRVPYILMHMRGTPQTMQSLTDYGSEGVTVAVASWLSERLRELEQLGVADVIVDPGFGFSKTVEQNYRLLRELPVLSRLLDNRPLLVGLSRKTMFWKPIGTTPENVLPATIAANTLALNAGASILRVHDVQAAVQACEVYANYNR